MKLFLKGTRCDTPKCAVERRDSPPGMHIRRGKLTDYAVHLREKQKVKHYYGILERQFRTYFSRASRSKGNTGAVLMSLLERRLDNVVLRLGFAMSRAQARQLVSHGHITVNNRTVNIPSYLLKVGDVIRIRNRVVSVKTVQSNLETAPHRVPDFLTYSADPAPEGRVVRFPSGDDISLPINAQLIIELCSR